MFPTSSSAQNVTEWFPSVNPVGVHVKFSSTELRSPSVPSVPITGLLYIAITGWSPLLASDAVKLNTIELVTGVVGLFEFAVTTGACVSIVNVNS